MKRLMKTLVLLTALTSLAATAQQRSEEHTSELQSH